ERIAAGIVPHAGFGGAARVRARHGLGGAARGARTPPFLRRHDYGFGGQGDVRGRVWAPSRRARGFSDGRTPETSFPRLGRAFLHDRPRKTGVHRRRRVPLLARRARAAMLWNALPVL